MKTISTITFLLAQLCFTPLLFAYEFSPIVQEFAPSGPGATRQFLLTNTQQDTVAIQIETFLRTTDERGNEQRTPDYDNFIITPPQMVVAPGKSQVVRVQWIGDSDIDSESSFRLITTQLPINFETAGEGDVLMSINMGYKYEAAIYVTPKKAKPKAELKSVSPASSVDGAKILQIVLESTGGTRAILVDPQIELASASSADSLTLKDEQLNALQMKNLISGSRTVFELPWPDGLPYGDVKASLDTRYFEN